MDSLAARAWVDHGFTAYDLPRVISVTDHDRIGLRLVPDATAGRLAVVVTPAGGGPSRRVLVDHPAGDPGEAEPVITALREAVTTDAHRR